MVANVSLDSAAVALLTAYTNAQSNIQKVQTAVNTGHDVNKASDNPLFYLQSQTLRNQASAYTNFMTKLTQNKSSLDRLQSQIKSITDTANKIRDTITGMSQNATAPEQTMAATNIKTYLMTIQNLISSSTDPFGYAVGGGKVVINIAPNARVDFTKSAAAIPAGVAITYQGVGLAMNQILKKTASQLPMKQPAAGTSPTPANLAATNPAYIQVAFAGTNYAADLSTATNRPQFLTDVSDFINNRLAQAAATAGVFSSALDSVLTNTQTDQNALNSEADALTKTDLTADSARSTALNTQSDLLTSLLQMHNQRSQAILSLFR